MQLIKKIGLKTNRNFVFPFFVNQKIVHFIIIFLVVLFASLNLAGKTQAVLSDESIKNTFLSEIVSSEFSDNDELIEEYFDESKEITSDQQTYLENLSMLKSQPIAEMISVDEAENIIIEENIVQDNNIIIRPDLVTTKRVKQQREEVIDYVVELGDTISTIASKFGISVNTVLWENNLNAYSLIRPGDKLLILPVSGISYNVKSGDTISKIAKMYEVDESVILEINKITSNSQLKIGKRLIILNGRKNGYAKQQSDRSNGLTAITKSITSLLKPKSSKSLSGNMMNWPTVGHRITQYYSWSHYALDVANKIGTPIYAADAGTVEVAGWGRGYGNQIVVNHGGGKKTRYAHLSKFYIKKGQSVDKGEAIGAMGSTGHSTGPHLHFEIMINNIKYNPLNYIK